MLKYLLIGIVLFWLVYLPISKRNRTRSTAATKPNPEAPPGQMQSDSDKPENMVACALCHVHLPSSDAYMDSADRPYCS